MAVVVHHATKKVNAAHISTERQGQIREFKRMIVPKVVQSGYQLTFQFHF